MPVVASIVTLATTQTLIATGGGAADKVTVIVKNASAAIFLGGAGLTTATGLPLATTEAVSLDLGPGDLLYAIASSGTPTVAVLKTRQ